MVDGQSSSQSVYICIFNNNDDDAGVYLGGMSGLVVQSSLILIYFIKILVCLSNQPFLKIISMWSLVYPFKKPPFVNFPSQTSIYTYIRQYNPYTWLFLSKFLSLVHTAPNINSSSQNFGSFIPTAPNIDSSSEIPGSPIHKITIIDYSYQNSISTFRSTPTLYQSL